MAFDVETQSRCKGSETRSHGIRVTVTPAFEPGESLADAERFVFSYRIRIANESDRRVQLLRRRWVIIDSDGDRSVVEGEGVVGQQPVIEPGHVFEYSSWCPLATSWGTMEGSFEMHAEPSETIRVAIGRFYLVGDDSHQAAESY